MSRSTLKPTLHSYATLSDCGTYRYGLLRAWESAALLSDALAVIMLNPSTADAEQDDPTIRRICAFAQREGYPGVLVMNLYALRSTDPSALLTHPDPKGPDNWSYLLGLRLSGNDVLFAWGSHPAARPQAQWLQELNAWPDAWCLGKTKDGSPKHPLYLRADTPFQRFYD